jgi:hypothetical protein
VIVKGIWWAAACWALLAILSVVYFQVRWLAEPDNPLRHEYAIGVATTLIYASPAGIVLLLLALPPHSYVHRNMKVAGMAIVALLAVLITTFYSLAS